MIRLTGKSGLAIYVNPDKIIGFIEDVNNGGTFINYGDDSYVVTESPEEVVRKIMEYKIRTIQYGQYLEDALMGGDWGKTKESKNALFHLAGLEDNQDG